MQIDHQDVSCRIQAIWYNIMSKCMSVLVNYHCVLYIRWSRYRAVEAVLWLGQRDIGTDFLMMELHGPRLVKEVL